MIRQLCEEQEAQGAQVMREVCGVPYTRTPRCQPPSHWAPGILCSCEGSGVRSCSPVGKEAEVIVCFQYLSLSHCLGLRRGNPSLSAADTVWLRGLREASLSLRACKCMGPVAAKSSSQIGEPGAFSLLCCLCPAEPACWDLWGVWCFSCQVCCPQGAHTGPSCQLSSLSREPGSFILKAG